MAEYQRIVLHLRYGSVERTTIRAAAELARMLGLVLHGVFLQDEALAQLVALPFVREFRLSTGAWQALDARRVAEEQRQAADQARLLLDEAAAAFGVSSLFNLGDELSLVSRHGDILVVAQPRLPAHPSRAHRRWRHQERARPARCSALATPRRHARDP